MKTLNLELIDDIPDSDLLAAVGGASSSANLDWEDDDTDDEEEEASTVKESKESESERWIQTLLKSTTSPEVREPRAKGAGKGDSDAAVSVERLDWE